MAKGAKILDFNKALEYKRIREILDKAEQDFKENLHVYKKYLYDNQPMKLMSVTYIDKQGRFKYQRWAFDSLHERTRGNHGCH